MGSTGPLATPQIATGLVNRCPILGGGCGTLIATFLGVEALPPEQAGPQRHQEQAVFSCNYNGWADVPEEEREGIDAFEAARVPPRAALKVALSLTQPLSNPHALDQRKAA
jgi:hypothetical protein